MTRNKIDITGNSLKMLAVITMLIDHVAVGIVLLWLNNQTDITVEQYNSYFEAYRVMRGIGRLAFPIYCFMLVEGFFHTHDVKKYMARLLAFALVSEIPFNLLLRRTLITFEKNNVGWALLIGLICIVIMEKIKNSENLLFSNIIAGRVAMVIVMLVGMIVGYICNVDYGGAGIAAICVLYFLYSTEVNGRIFAIAMAVVVLALMSSKTEVYALVLAVPFYFYNGNRGTDSIALRRFFYLFYPVHLLVIYLIGLAIV